MDIGTIIGLVLGIGMVLGAILLGGGGIGTFINYPSLMITIGGSFATLFINFPLKSVLGVPGVVKKCFTVKLPSPPEIIEQFKALSEVARREGVLILESKLEEIDDGFMKRGIEMIIVGAAPDDIRNVLETEMSYVEERHKTGKKIMDGMAAAAPAFGMIGTLIGLVQMLRELDDPSQIGVGMATALLTTLYGAVVANLFCIPLAGKLEARNTEEMLVRDLMVSGLLLLAKGESPRTIGDNLASYLSPAIRSSDAKAA